MKAKMPESQKPAEPGSYECMLCDTIFTFKSETESLVCPRCGNDDRNDLIPIYMVDNPLEQKMYTAADWHGG